MGRPSQQRRAHHTRDDRHSSRLGWPSHRALGCCRLRIPRAPQRSTAHSYCFERARVEGWQGRGCSGSMALMGNALAGRGVGWSGSCDGSCGESGTTERRLRCSRRFDWPRCSTLRSLSVQPMRPRCSGRTRIGRCGRSARRRGATASPFWPGEIARPSGSPAGTGPSTRRRPSNWCRCGRPRAPDVRVSGVCWCRPSSTGRSTLVRRRSGLWVTRGNEPAQRLYQSIGFRVTGEHQPLPSDPCKDEVRMVLGLDAR
jgi:hypothetical protein